MILKTELLEKIQDCKETISDIEKDIEIYRLALEQMNEGKFKKLGKVKYD